MPDVTVDNPKVQFDLKDGETTTVPAGEQWQVKLLGEPGGSVPRLNGVVIATTSSGYGTSNHIDVSLFDGDTIEAAFGPIRIRGYVVS